MALNHLMLLFQWNACVKRSFGFDDYDTVQEVQEFFANHICENERVKRCWRNKKFDAHNFVRVIYKERILAEDMKIVDISDAPVQLLCVVQEEER